MRVCDSIRSPNLNVQYRVMLRSRDKDRYNWKTPYMTSAGGIVSMSRSSDFGFDMIWQKDKDGHSLGCLRLARWHFVARSQALEKDQRFRQQLLRLGWRGLGGKILRCLCKGVKGIHVQQSFTEFHRLWKRVKTPKVERCEKSRWPVLIWCWLGAQDDELHHRLRLNGLLYGDCFMAREVRCAQSITESDLCTFSHVTSCNAITMCMS